MGRTQNTFQSYLRSHISTATSTSDLLTYLLLAIVKSSSSLLVSLKKEGKMGILDVTAVAN